jgi:hypothetical protein
MPPVVSLQRGGAVGEFASAVLVLVAAIWIIPDRRFEKLRSEKT